jgi:hypothetical protein
MFASRRTIPSRDTYHCPRVLTPCELGVTLICVCLDGVQVVNSINEDIKRQERRFKVRTSELPTHWST